jgi:thiol-disulfide isomerase/thioredoxin
MGGTKTGRAGAAVLVLVVGAAAFGEVRTWTDASGKFSVDAELVGVDGGQVTLRSSDGKTLAVPLSRLSAADRRHLAAQGNTGEPAVPGTAAEQIAGIAERFFGDLRTTQRDVARQSLTKKAQDLMSSGKSPLVGLPKPEEGERTIRTGRVNVDGDVAEVPVFVRAGGHTHKTKLHLRREAESWVVFALSAEYPDGEKSINFEIAGAAENTDPLRALVGNAIQLEGFTLEGQPLSLADYKGKVVLIDFWATWCGPCRAEIPNIRETYAKYNADGFDVIAVSVDQDLKALQSFVAQETPPWAVVADNHPRNSKSMAAKYGIRGIPAFILIGPDGKVATVHCRGPRLGEAVGRLLQVGG